MSLSSWLSHVQSWSHFCEFVGIYCQKSILIGVKCATLRQRPVVAVADHHVERVLPTPRRDQVGQEGLEGTPHHSSEEVLPTDSHLPTLLHTASHYFTGLGTTSHQSTLLLVETKWVKKVWKVLPTTQEGLEGTPYHFSEVVLPTNSHYSKPLHPTPHCFALLRTTSQYSIPLHTTPRRDQVGQERLEGTSHYFARQGHLAHRKQPPPGTLSSICLGPCGGPRGGGGGGCYEPGTPQCRTRTTASSSRPSGSRRSGRCVPSSVLSPLLRVCRSSSPLLLSIPETSGPV